MLERTDQPERDRRTAYMDGYKAGIYDYSNTLPRGVLQRTVFNELLKFHDHHLMLWTQRDLEEKVPPPKAAIRQLQE